jgi:hypothetical protein
MTAPTALASLLEVQLDGNPEQRLARMSGLC